MVVLQINTPNLVQGNESQCMIKFPYFLTNAHINLFSYSSTVYGQCTT